MVAGGTLIQIPLSVGNGVVIAGGGVVITGGCRGHLDTDSAVSR